MEEREEKCTGIQNLNFTFRCKYVSCMPLNRSHLFGLLRLWHFGLVTGRQECLTSDRYNLSAPSSLHLLANGPAKSPRRCGQYLRRAPSNIQRLHSNRKHITVDMNCVWVSVLSSLACVCLTKSGASWNGSNKAAAESQSGCCCCSRDVFISSIHIWPTRGTTLSSGCILGCTCLNHELIGYNRQML